ncbi:uncharacterized protein LOC117221243 [Megalopta genalis]|uniref:uncharacterized protein LOC117221243 n=1 Tax=Megalopta genalis TaxID=115081 RepID=UPI003FD3B760
MKLAAILLCALCVLSYKVDADNGNSCLGQEGISITELPQLFSDQSDEAIRRRGCLEACYFQKLGLMNDNVINMDEINNQIDKVASNTGNAEKIREATTQCANDAAGDDRCTVAQKFAQCGLEQLQISIRSMMQQIA